MRTNFLKDILLSTFLLLVFCFVANIQIGKDQFMTKASGKVIAFPETKTLQLYVYSIKLDKPNYGVGNDIAGTFNLSNIGNDSLQDGYYTVALGEETNNNLIDESSRISIPYVKENSKREIRFDYGLSRNVSGNTNLIISVYLPDGTIVARGYQKIYIQGEPQFKVVDLTDVTILKNGVVYDKDYGLTLGEKDELSISFGLKSVKQTKVSVEVYDISNAANVVEITDVDLDKANKDGKSILEIPTKNLTAGKYIAKIFLTATSTVGLINPIKVEFVMDGLISHIKAVSSDKFSLSKNEKFNLSVTYEGYGKTEDQNIQERMSGASLYLTVTNENDADVFMDSMPIDLSQYNAVLNVPTRSQNSAEYLNILAEIKDSAGLVIDSYSSILPSEKEANLLYPEKKSNNVRYSVLGVLLLLILLIIIALVNNKKNKNASGSDINVRSARNSKRSATATSTTTTKKTSRRKTSTLAIIIAVFLSTANISLAFTSSDVSSLGDSTLLSSFNVASVSSPLPSAISFYNPGDTFNVNLLVNKASALNASIYYLLPPDQNNWSDWNVSDISIDKMILSRSVNIVSDKNYKVSNTPGLYNFTFYVAVADVNKSNFVIKKITQPILVSLPSNQLIGDAGTLAYAGQSTPQAVTCNSDHKEGEKICDMGTPGIWNCESTLGKCEMNYAPVSGGVIITGGIAAPAVTTSRASGVHSADLFGMHFLGSLFGIGSFDSSSFGAKLLVTSNIPGIVNGNKFYVITDLQNSDWVDKEYAYTEFTYGVAKKSTYEPYSSKSNLHIIAYDGVNTVVATSQYVGKDSKFRNASVTIREIGSLTSPTACRNIPESEIGIMFNTPNSLSSIPLCAYPVNTIFSTGVSTYTPTVRSPGSGKNSRGNPVSMSVDICAHDPSIKNGDNFYAVVDSMGTTNGMSTRYSFFFFVKGQYKASTYMYNDVRTNRLVATYDGGCGLNLWSQYSGKRSDYTDSVIDLLEIGVINDKTCYYSGYAYPSNFNRRVAWLPPISPCQGNNAITCTTGAAEWKLNQDTGACTNFLSCIFKNSRNESIYTIPVGEPFSFDADFATSTNLSLLSYSWNFGDGAEPALANTKSGSLKYNSAGLKTAELQVLLNGVVLEQGQCSAISVTCPSGDCSNVGAGCGVSEVSSDLGLNSSSPYLCPGGQTVSGFGISSLITRGSPAVWSWKCNSLTGETQCSAKCKTPLTYCPDTGKCSGSCNGDKCASIPGIQDENNLLFKVAGCNDPTLSMKLTFDKPYANVTTSQCAVTWIPNSSLSDLSYTSCKLDGKDVPNNASNYPVYVGRHNLSCITKVSDPATPDWTSKSPPFDIPFRCSRVPVSVEN